MDLDRKELEKEIFETYNYNIIVDDAINLLKLSELGKIVKVKGTDIVLNDEFSSAYKLINELYNKCSVALKDAREIAMNEMKDAYMQTGSQKTSNNHMSITYKIPTAKETFDIETFKQDHPDLYQRYLTYSSVKESILVKMKDNK